MSVTQKQLAQHLGVSQTLIGAALNGKGRVSEEMRLKVQEKARELGYHAGSNHEARSLIARRYGQRVHSDIIAVLMPQLFFGGLALPRVPFFAPFIEGVEQAAAERKLDIHLCTPPEEERLPRLLERRGVDGVICLAQSPSGLSSTGLPAVQFGGPSEGMTGLMPDDREGARLATQHLTRLGHRRIACLAFSSSFKPGQRYHAAAERMAGYSTALTDAGIAKEDRMFGGYMAEPTVEDGAAGMANLLKAGRDFSAVVCFNDTTAMGAIETLRKNGKRVPEDVSVSGFDDVSEQYAFEPKLTSISFDRFAMGKRAVELICEAREQEEWKPAPDEVFPVGLVVGDSTQKFSA